MYKINHTKPFKKDLKKFLNNSKKLELISDCIELLKENGFSAIPSQMKPHKLKGNYKDMLECHIQPDLLIIWFQITNLRKKFI